MGERAGERGLSRGMRNNNPLNIRRSETEWKGQNAVQNDPHFVQFSSLTYGFRAAFITIRTYMRKYGLCCVEQIIQRWAPPSENDTESYIQVVCDWSGLKRDEMLRFSDMSQMLRLVQAMAYVENGVLISKLGSMAQGYNMAAPQPPKGAASGSLSPSTTCHY